MSTKKKLPEILVQQTQLLEVDLPESAEELKELLVQQENILARAEAKHGFGFLALKEMIGHGNFSKWLKRAGFNERTVRKRMQAARFLLSLPEEQRPKLIGLTQQKLIALAKAEPEAVDQLLESEEAIEDLNELSYTDLRNKVRKLENASTNMAVELESRKAENKSLKAELNRRRKDPGYSSFVEVSRHEGNALTEKILLCLDDLERNVAELVALPKNVEPQHLSVAVNRLYLHLNTVAKRSGGVLGQLAEQFADVIREEVDPSLIFLPDEVEAAARERRDMIGDHEQEKLLREDARERAKPRGRGRPKKSKATKG